MADLPATKLHRHNKIAHKQEAEYWIKIQYVLLTLRMDKLNNNLEFCCSTLHQIVLVDQNSLFGIFSGGLSSCYHFCIWAALLAYLTRPSRQVPRKNIFWSIHHPRVLHFVQAVRLSICVVSPQHRQTDRGKVQQEEYIPTLAKQTNKNRAKKHNFFKERNLFVTVRPSTTVGSYW